MAERELDPTVGGLRDEDVEGRDWERVQPRRISDANWKRFEGYMSEILQALGMPLNTPGTSKTPQRYLRALFDSTEGYEGDAKLVTAFPTECEGGPDCEVSQVIEGPIPFYSLCEHHAFPFFGHAYLGYVAHEHIIGISKLTRLLRLFARRFTFRNASVATSPRRSRASCRPTALPSTSKRLTSAPRCAAFASPSRRHGRPSGAGTTSRIRSYERSS